MVFQHALACLACGSIGEVSRLSARFHNAFPDLKVCWKCGSQQGWRDAVVYRVSTGIWLNPLTWGSGYWVEKKGD